MVIWPGKFLCENGVWVRAWLPEPDKHKNLTMSSLQQETNPFALKITDWVLAAARHLSMSHFESQVFPSHMAQVQIQVIWSVHTSVLYG